MIEILRILVAPLVWLAAFSGVYGLHGLGCALQWPQVEMLSLSLSLYRFLLLVAWLAAILAQIALVAALRSERFGSSYAFIRWTSIATGWVGLVATVWTLHPVAVISACG